MLYRYMLRAATIGLIALTALAASAAEITFFESPDFQGRSMTLRSDERNFDRDFNDRAQSIIVRDGNWDVCIDADFRGGCLTLRPGEYRQLEGVWSRSLSSARYAGGGYEGGGPPRPGGAEIVLFEDADFRGGQRVLRSDDRDLDRSGFNDKTESIMVRGGVWEVCIDSEYRGGCMTLRPGDYPRLERHWSRSISSARLAGYDGNNAGYPPPSGILPPPRPNYGGGGVSTCTAPQVGQCGPCAVTCTDGQRASCSPGSMGVVSWCVTESRCVCR